MPLGRVVYTPGAPRKLFAMHDALRDRFPPFANGSQLKSAIEAICSDFGKVTRIEIVPARTNSGMYCACFVRLDSSVAEAALEAQYRIVRLGDDMYFSVDVADEWIP